MYKKKPLNTIDKDLKIIKSEGKKKKSYSLNTRTIKVELRII